MALDDSDRDADHKNAQGAKQCLGWLDKWTVRCGNLVEWDYADVMRFVTKEIARAYVSMSRIQYFNKIRRQRVDDTYEQWRLGCRSILKICVSGECISKLH